MVKILGVDIGNGSAVCCCLESDLPLPSNLDGLLYYHFEANVKGIKAILELDPDIAIVEPTGINYAKLWVTHLARAGVEVRLVAHNALASHRIFLRLPDKDDEFDAYALAHYGIININNPKSFLQVRDVLIVRIRKLVLRLAHLNRVQSPIVNRLRQDLSWQFPEVSKVRFTDYGDRPPLLWRWLAGENPPRGVIYDRKYQQTVGLGLESTVRLHAQRLIELNLEERLILKDLQILLSESCFQRYIQVFSEFGFDFRMNAILISQIYPIQGFLGENGKPIVLYRKGRQSGKTTKREISRRRFQKALGLSPQEFSSGTKNSRQLVGGSDLSRKAFWLYIFRCETSAFRHRYSMAREVYQWIRAPERVGVPIKKLRINAAAYVCRKLFYRLCDAIL